MELVLKTNIEKLQMVVAVSNVLLDYARGELNVPQSTIDYIYNMQLNCADKEYVKVAKALYKWSKED